MEKYRYKIVDSPEELLKAFCVRNIVFVDEQNCPYEIEYDGLDEVATHFLVVDGGEPVATARIRNVGDGVKFERLAVRKEYRGTGVGRQLLLFITDHIERNGARKIVMHAQAHLKGYYEKFGFVSHGDIFIEAGIEHYHMEKTLRDRSGH